MKMLSRKAQKLLYCNGRPYYVARYAPLPPPVGHYKKKIVFLVTKNLS
jgi:hypothetical protein